MASRFEVEVTLMSGKDLKNINWRYGPIRPYAVVWVDPQLKCSTRVDEEGDTCPRWNEKLVISLDRPIDDDSTLCFDIVHSKSPDEDVKPLIGSAKLKLHEFVDVDGIGSKSLRLKRPSGRPHGKIDVKISVCNPRYRTPDPLVAPYGVGGGDYAAPPTTYDAPSPAYGAPTPAYGAPTPAYGSPTPEYGAPTPAYGAPTPAYSAPTPEYGAPIPAYGAPAAEYGAPTPAYGAPTPAYGAQTPAYGSPSRAYGAPTPAYGAPPPQHGYSGAPTYGTTPAYGAAPIYKQEERKKSMFGGMGKGLAIGAVAGALGGLVFAEGLDKFEDHIAHKAADRVEEDLAEDDEW